jgi:uncharacterized membrane protein YhhN
MTLLPWIATCGLATAGLLIADRRGSRAGRWVAKPLASLSFVGLAAAGGAAGSAYGRAILAALALCVLGDVLLIPERAGPTFLAGLVSFLLGHLAFAGAFLLLGPDWTWTAGTAAALVVPVGLVLRWLLPHLRGPMRVAVPAYVAVITAMVALATGAGWAEASWLLPTGAALFFLSDLSVARDRFVRPGWVNRSWGLPLYYAAQILLALSVAAYRSKG